MNAETRGAARIQTGRAGPLPENGPGSANEGVPAWALAWRDEPHRLATEFPSFVSSWVQAADNNPDSGALAPSGCFLQLARNLFGLIESTWQSDATAHAIFDRLERLAIEHPRSVAARSARETLVSYPAEATGDVDRARRYFRVVAREDPSAARLATSDLRAHRDLQRGVGIRREPSVVQSRAAEDVQTALSRYGLTLCFNGEPDVFANAIPFVTAVTAAASPLATDLDVASSADRGTMPGAHRRWVTWTSLGGLHSRLVAWTDGGHALATEDFGALGTPYVDLDVTLALVRLARSPKSPDSQVDVLVDLVAGGRLWTRRLDEWRYGEVAIDVGGGVVRITPPGFGPIEYRLADGSTDEALLARRILACRDPRLAVGAVDWALRLVRAMHTGSSVDVTGARSALREAASTEHRSSLRSSCWRAAAELAEFSGDIDDAIYCFERALSEDPGAGVKRQIKRLRTARGG